MQFICHPIDDRDKCEECEEKRSVMLKDDRDYGACDPTRAQSDALTAFVLRQDR